MGLISYSTATYRFEGCGGCIALGIRSISEVYVHTFRSTPDDRAETGCLFLSHRTCMISAGTKHPSRRARHSRQYPSPNRPRSRHACPRARSGLQEQRFHRDGIAVQMFQRALANPPSQRGSRRLGDEPARGGGICASHIRRRGPVADGDTLCDRPHPLRHSDTRGRSLSRNNQPKPVSRADIGVAASQTRAQMDSGVPGMTHGRVVNQYHGITWVCWTVVNSTVCVSSHREG